MASGEESSSSIDDDRYRAEVLGLDGDETEDRIEARLITDATDLGLRVPDIQIAASLAASISAGFLDIISSSSSSTSTPTRSSLAHSSLPDVARGSGAATTAASIDHLTSSFSDTTLSDRGHSDSIPSIDSSSTCPTSISSYDGRPSLHNERYARGQRNSHSGVARSTERKRSSFIHAIGKPFRRRRMPSAIILPPDAQVVLRREGGDSTMLVETKTVTPSRVENPAAQEKVHVEVPVFDEASMQRSLDNEQLRDMFSRHKAIRLRFVRLQNDVLDTLKGKHLAVIAQQKIRNESAEREKEKQNNAHIARMEERQLEIEIDQIKEFDKAKRHSEIRIKHMEGYFHTPSPPASPALGSENGSDAAARSNRTVTQRQKEQLAQEYLDRDSMNQLHDARVKVLRERQERQLQETTARLQNELEALINGNTDSIADLERDHQREEQEILQAFDSKKNKLRWRWNIEEAILRKKLQQRDGKPYGPLPTISFSCPDDEAPILRNPFADSQTPQ